VECFTPTFSKKLFGPPGWSKTPFSIHSLLGIVLRTVPVPLGGVAFFLFSLLGGLYPAQIAPFPRGDVLGRYLFLSAISGFCGCSFRLVLIVDPPHSPKNLFSGEPAFPFCSWDILYPTTSFVRIPQTALPRPTFFLRIFPIQRLSLGCSNSAFLLSDFTGIPLHRDRSAVFRWRGFSLMLSPLVGGELDTENSPRTPHHSGLILHIPFRRRFPPEGPQHTCPPHPLSALVVFFFLEILGGSTSDFGPRCPCRARFFFFFFSVAGKSFFPFRGC